MTTFTENDQRNTSDVERSDVATIECLRAEVRRLRLELQQEREMKTAYIKLIQHLQRAVS